MRRLLLLLVPALLLIGAVSPASADTVTVSDPADEFEPDIRALFANNGAQNITLRLRFTELKTPTMGGEEIHFGKSTSERHWVLSATWNYMLEKWMVSLKVVKADGSFGADIPCNIARKRDAQAETSQYVFARSCISNLPNNLRFWGSAFGPGVDETKTSALIAKG